MMASMQVDRAGLEVLDHDECLRLLALAHWGRVAITVGALPAILPVRFVLDGKEILFRAGHDTALAAGTQGAVVAFQVDGGDESAPGHWSVLATGLARHVDGSDLGRAAERALPAWSAERPDHVIALAPEVISGRRTL
jgi:nitroimidazol reductase NimA-like FMN-containing flavoprotein (pyridoxamine 5'-phosphate oxidase superfamily)